MEFSISRNILIALLIAIMQILDAVGSHKNALKSLGQGWPWTLKPLLYKNQRRCRHLLKRAVNYIDFYMSWWLSAHQQVKLLASYKLSKSKSLAKECSGVKGSKQMLVSMFLSKNNTRTSIRITWIVFTGLLNALFACRPIWSILAFIVDANSEVGCY